VIEVQVAATPTCINESQQVVAQWIRFDSIPGRGPISKQEVYVGNLSLACAVLPLDGSVSRSSRLMAKEHTSGSRQYLQRREKLKGLRIQVGLLLGLMVPVHVQRNIAMTDYMEMND